MEECKKCVIHCNIIKEYSDKLLDQQRQIEILASRLLKYEPDFSICDVKIEQLDEKEIDSDHDVVGDYNAHSSDNDFKDLKLDQCLELSIGLDQCSVTSNDFKHEQSSDSSDQEVKSVEHEGKIKRKMRKCKTCFEEFSSSRAVVRHQHEMHGAPIKFKCDRCPKSFYDANSFKKHCGTSHKKTTEMDKEKQRFYCDTCAKSFTSNSVLIVHKRIHTGEKPYKCDQCENRYAQSSSLKIHERTHSLERPYMCHLCSKTFLHRSSFNLHIKTHGNIKPFKCNLCDKAFLQKAKLVVHIQSHTGERPVKCPVCDKGYTKRYHVRKHLKNFHKVIDIDAILGSRKRGFEREPVPYDKLQLIQVKKE